MTKRKVASAGRFFRLHFLKLLYNEAVIALSQFANPMRYAMAITRRSLMRKVENMGLSKPEVFFAMFTTAELANVLQAIEKCDQGKKERERRYRAKEKEINRKSDKVLTHLKKYKRLDNALMNELIKALDAP